MDVLDMSNPLEMGISLHTRESERERGRERGREKGRETASESVKDREDADLLASHSVFAKEEEKTLPSVFVHLYC